MFWFDCDCHVLRYVTHCIWLNPLVCVRALALDCGGTQRLTTEMPLARTQSSTGSLLGRDQSLSLRQTFRNHLPCSPETHIALGYSELCGYGLI